MHVVQRCSWWMTVVWLVAALSTVRTAMVSRFPLNFRHNHKMAFRIFYQIGTSESDLPECSEMAVCNRVDTYSPPGGKKGRQMPWEKKNALPEKGTLPPFHCKKRPDVEEVSTNTPPNAQRGHFGPGKIIVNHRSSPVRRVSRKNTFGLIVAIARRNFLDKTEISNLRFVKKHSRSLATKVVLLMPVYHVAADRNCINNGGSSWRRAEYP
ncbi:hypothetical protein HNY73_001792 [Argiope bruennichi]|uniref:Secreted protein n=1 Tax=Argiope bruennichi TaxID=94029 RepID=A0A8T0FRF7_ARGBR|nr:hypothetical protein HNY73_001792 [Argiope bruennichi]